MDRIRFIHLCFILISLISSLFCRILFPGISVTGIVLITIAVSLGGTIPHRLRFQVRQEHQGGRQDQKTCKLKLLPDEAEIIEAELFSPESDFDGVPAGSQEKGQVLLHKLQ